MIDYSLMAMQELRLSDITNFRWDVFISAFNASERVQSVFEQASAERKHWLVHPEYAFAAHEMPLLGEAFHHDERDEAQWLLEYLDWAELPEPTANPRLCFDITGMMRPHLLLLPKLLALRGYRLVDFVYTDPISYVKGATTKFSRGDVSSVRQVRGLEGQHSPESLESGTLIIGAGYDDELIRRVAESKPATSKMQLFGLPSLKAHMYQESHLRSYLAAEAIAPLPSQGLLFAPAHNPLVTAQVLSDATRNIASENLYLCPLGTKAQVLGFSLFYLCERDETPASVLFPFAPSYTQETSIGISRISHYVLELDWFRCWS